MKIPPKVLIRDLEGMGETASLEFLDKVNCDPISHRPVLVVGEWEFGGEAESGIWVLA